jgi:hypothetical protein
MSGFVSHFDEQCDRDGRAPTFQLHGSNFALKAPAAVWDN